MPGRLSSAGPSLVGPSSAAKRKRLDGVGSNGVTARRRRGIRAADDSESEPDETQTPSQGALGDHGNRSDSQSYDGNNSPQSCLPRAQQPSEWGVFDPDQPIEERRRIQAQYRELLRGVQDNAEEFMKPESAGIRETLQRADALADEVRMTADATFDSRLLLNTADLAIRKAKRMTEESRTKGINVDEFVAKLMRYMRRGAESEIIANYDDDETLTSTQRRATRLADEDENGYDTGDMFDWAYLGRHACVPLVRRPQISSFLIGPLSVEKKARKVAKRTAPLRVSEMQETRPEVLRVEDLAQTKDDLASMCARILQTLAATQEQIQRDLQDAITADMDQAQATRLMHGRGMRSTGGLDLMRFVVNPHSFQQTVENVFYVSFLIRDGKAKLELDEHGLYSVAPVTADADDERAPNAAKHQGILSIDENTWRDIVTTLDIKEPMISHREYASQGGPGARGWYS